MYTYINIFLITCRVTVAPDVVCLVYPVARKRFLANPENNLSCFSKTGRCSLFRCGRKTFKKKKKKIIFLKEITLKAKISDSEAAFHERPFRWEGGRGEARVGTPRNTPPFPGQAPPHPPLLSEEGHVQVDL